MLNGELLKPPRYSEKLEIFSFFAQNMGIPYQEENNFKDGIWFEHEDKLYIHKNNNLKG